MSSATASTKSRPERSDWELADFVEIMRALPAPGTPETQRLLKAVRASARSPSLEDDFP